jgi:hypothetical protein
VNSRKAAGLPHRGDGVEAPELDGIADHVGPIATTVTRSIQATRAELIGSHRRSALGITAHGYQSLSVGTREECAWCGTSFCRQRRAQRFCSTKCQKTGRRAELAVGAFLPRPLGRDSGVGGFSAKNPNKINSEIGRFARSTPLNLLGGHRWPDVMPIEPDLHRAILAAEVGGRKL